jgi:precorrin-6B methylase 2
MLVRLVKAERVLEIGVFTGFTALGMALALPAHGRLIGCELEEKWTEMAKPYWKAAGVSDRIELRIGAASQTLASVYTQSHMLALRPARCLQLWLLQSVVDWKHLDSQRVGLLEQAGPESFDLVFIDANKSQYDLYYEAALQLLRPGGVCVVDNVLWKGEVKNWAVCTSMLIPTRSCPMLLLIGSWWLTAVDESGNQSRLHWQADEIDQAAEREDPCRWASWHLHGSDSGRDHHCTQALNVKTKHQRLAWWLPPVATVHRHHLAAWHEAALWRLLVALMGALDRVALRARAGDVPRVTKQENKAVFGVTQLHEIMLPQELPQQHRATVAG